MFLHAVLKFMLENLDVWSDELVSSNEADYCRHNLPEFKKKLATKVWL